MGPLDFCKRQRRGDSEYGARRFCLRPHRPMGPHPRPSISRITYSTLNTAYPASSPANTGLVGYIRAHTGHYEGCIQGVCMSRAHVPGALRGSQAPTRGIRRGSTPSTFYVLGRPGAYIPDTLFTTSLHALHTIHMPIQYSPLPVLTVLSTGRDLCSQGLSGGVPPQGSGPA